MCHHPNNNNNNGNNNNIYAQCVCDVMWYSWWPSSWPQCLPASDQIRFGPLLFLCFCVCFIFFFMFFSVEKKYIFPAYEQYFFINVGKKIGKRFFNPLKKEKEKQKKNGKQRQWERARLHERWSQKNLASSSTQQSTSLSLPAWCFS